MTPHIAGPGPHVAAPAQRRHLGKSEVLVIWRHGKYTCVYIPSCQTGLATCVSFPSGSNESYALPLQECAAVSTYKTYRALQHISLEQLFLYLKVRIRSLVHRKANFVSVPSRPLVRVLHQQISGVTSERPPWTSVSFRLSGTGPVAESPMCASTRSNPCHFNGTYNQNVLALVGTACV